MSTKAQNKKIISIPTNGKINQTNSAKTKITWKEENSSTNKYNRTSTNHNSINNLDVSNGKTSIKVSPFLSNNLNSADDSDLASFCLNNLSNNENVLTKIFSKNNEDEIFSSNREQFAEIILEYMKNKLENLDSLIKCKTQVTQQTYNITNTQEITMISEIDKNLENKYGNEEISIETNKFDFIDTYTPFTNIEREKILREIELNAESRQAKYSNLFNKMKLEFRDVINLAEANEVIDETENEEIKDLNQYLSPNNNVIEKVTNFDTIQIEKPDTDLFLPSYAYNSNLVIVENDNDLKIESVLNTEGSIPQEIDYSNDLKKRLNNLKSASRSNLHMRSKSNKNTTAEKLNVVKKMGKPNPVKKKTSINKGGAKKNQESDNLNNTTYINTTINQNNISNSLNTTEVKSTKQVVNEKRIKRISNGATESTASKDQPEQVNPRKRFYTQARPKSKANPQDLAARKEENNMNIIKSKSIVQNKETITSLNCEELHGIQIKKYNTNTNIMANLITKSNVTINAINQSENNIDTGGAIPKSSSVMIINSQPVSNPNPNCSITANETINFDSNYSPNEKLVTEFKTDLNSQEKRKNYQENIAFKFKNIVLNENKKENNLNMKGSKCPDKLNPTKNLKITTIESVPYQDLSDDEIPDLLNYYTVNEESVLHKFPVLSIKTQHMTNNSLLGRNTKIKTDKILIHAGSGKRIKPETRLETIDNKENMEDVGPCSICRTRCAIL